MIAVELSADDCTLFAPLGGRLVRLWRRLSRRSAPRSLAHSIALKLAVRKAADKVEPFKGAVSVGVQIYQPMPKAWARTLRRASVRQGVIGRPVLDEVARQAVHGCELSGIIASEGQVAEISVRRQWAPAGRRVVVVVQGFRSGLVGVKDGERRQP